MTKILVTGGCGYVGSILVPKLLESNYKVLVVDNQWFGNNLPIHKNLEVLKESISSIGPKHLNGVQKIIHLANIANDPSVELNPVLSWEVNVLHMVQLLQNAKIARIDEFIYASSGSVYGVKAEEKVTEDLELTPISIYNKTKMAAERVALSYASDFKVVCVRPATVCGVSPRMRFDVAVNMFVLQAFEEKKIKVLGGNQTRPNIHIKDMAALYEHILRSGNIESGVYNAGFENLTINEIAKMVQEICGGEIEVLPSNDPRSYRQDSTKLMNTGFSPNYQVKDAIVEIWEALNSGHIKNELNWHTVRAMKHLGLGDISQSGKTK